MSSTMVRSPISSINGDFEVEKSTIIGGFLATFDDLVLGNWFDAGTMGSSTAA